MGTPITPAYLSLRDAVLYSGISYRSWHFILKTRPDAPRRIQVSRGRGGKILLARADIDNFLDRLKQEPGTLVDGIVDWAIIELSRKGSQN